MTPAEQAAKAIKDATGWDAEPLENGAKVQRPNNGPEILLIWSDAYKDWRCQICLGVSWLTGRDFATPEAAIEAVLPRYRAHIAALAADILPGWPRLEWQGPRTQCTLVLVTGRFVTPILIVCASPDMWWLTVAGSAHRARTPADVWAAVVAHIETLGLPCALPPFPGASDA